MGNLFSIHLDVTVDNNVNPDAHSCLGLICCARHLLCSKSLYQQIYQNEGKLFMYQFIKFEMFELLNLETPVDRPFISVCTFYNLVVYVAVFDS